jgi:ABC-type sugar transport system ATPase subunit
MEEKKVRQSSALVSMSGVSKRFGGVSAIEGVDFDLREGEVHALVGENGAGKSTLMKVLSGVHRPDQGRLEVGGREVAFDSVRDAASEGIALVPQELELFEELTVTENLFVGRSRPRKGWLAFDWASMREQAEAVFERLGVRLDIGALVKDLSPANRQMVEIGRGLIRDARVLIMDEPTAALSERETSALFDAIASITARGVCVVYISHRLEEIFRVSHRVTVMRDGKKIETRPTKDFSHEELIRLMVGRELAALGARDEAPVGEVLLEVRGLSKLGEFEDVSFSLRSGEVVGLSGLVGAGRTEVARAIFGVSSADAGTVLVGGRAVEIKSPAEAQKAGIAYLPEERRSEGLILPFSISENVTFANLDALSRVGFVNTSEQRRVARNFADTLRIRCNSVQDPVSSLSGGNQQKVVLAKSLSREPSVLMLDEPTRGVDVGAKSEIYRLIDSLARSGKAVLVISSELEEVLTVSNRVLVMREGRLVGEFSQSEATQELLTAAAMGVTGRSNGTTKCEAETAGGGSR